MRSIGGELPQLPERFVEARERTVKNFSQMIEFVAGAMHGNSFVERLEVICSARLAMLWTGARMRRATVSGGGGNRNHRRKHQRSRDQELVERVPHRLFALRQPDQDGRPARLWRRRTTDACSNKSLSWCGE